MIHFTIPLQPISKKNSQQIAYRWGKDKTTGKPKRTPFIRPSENFIAYERAALWHIPKRIHIDYPVNVKCLFYMKTRGKCDLTNMLEAVDDIMVKAGLLADDNFTIIESHDGSRVLYDKESPRTEVYIEKIND
ncbi:hypothetical protein ACPA0F_09015 [Solibacillus silvestris]